MSAPHAEPVTVADLYRAAALKGILANPHLVRWSDDDWSQGVLPLDKEAARDAITARAAQLADSLLAQRHEQEDHT